MLLVVAVLLLCTLAPRPRQPALLLPLPGLATADVAAFARHHDLRLIGRGRVPGSLVVADAGPERMTDAICAGLLLIHAPGTLCGPAQTSH
ncbi:MAG: hypothetical protein KGN34_16245 [Sphingomonadales bacterium]|nr:hypothetical protein [Sphingomonadales bacterium]